MAWKERSVVSLRQEFVQLACQEEANIRALCRHYRISPTTGYKWLRRFEAEGVAGLEDRSRWPRPPHPRSGWGGRRPLDSRLRRDEKGETPG